MAYATTTTPTTTTTRTTTTTTTTTTTAPATTEETQMAYARASDLAMPWDSLKKILLKGLN